MTVTDIQKPSAAAPAARPVSSAARLAWLHLRSRRAPAALAALLACGAALWASLHYHWWLGTGNAADELPMILQGCAAGIIAVTTHSPFGEPERATGWRLPLLRAGLVLALCGAAIGFFALGAAVAYNPRAGVYLAGPATGRPGRLDRRHGRLRRRPDRVHHQGFPRPPVGRVTGRRGGRC